MEERRGEGKKQKKDRVLVMRGGGGIVVESGVGMNSPRPLSVAGDEDGSGRAVCWSNQALAILPSSLSGATSTALKVVILDIT